MFRPQETTSSANGSSCGHEFYGSPLNHDSVSSAENNKQRRLYWETVMDSKDGTTSSSNLAMSPMSSSSGGAGSSQPSSSTGDTNSAMRPSKRKNFYCPTCLTGYVQKGDYMRHIRTRHEGIRPYPCTTCGEHFSRRSILNKHLRTHDKNRKGVSKPAGSH